MRTGNEDEERLRLGRVYRSYLRQPASASSRLPTLLFFTGFALALLGMSLMILAGASSGSETGVSGVVIIGVPIPIGIAFGPHALALTIVALIILLISLILTLWWLPRRYAPSSTAPI